MQAKPPLQRQIQQRIEQQPVNGQQALWPELLTAKDFLSKPPDPTRWLWEDCLPLGACSVLVAAPKTGKTHLAVAICMAIARGYPLLGRGVQKAKAAYIFLDGHEDELKEVFIKFGLNQEDQVMFHGGSVSTPAPVQWAIHCIEKHQVKFLVLDTFQKIFRPRNINDYAEVTNLMEPLQKAAQDHGCHIQYLHHAGKPNEQRGDLDSGIGTSAIRANCYSLLHLKRLNPDDARSPRILRSDQRGGRIFEEIEISSGEDGFIKKLGTKEDAQARSTANEMEDFIRNNNGCTNAELRAGIRGDWRILWKAKKLLEKGQRIEIVGTGKKNDAQRHYIAGSLIPEQQAEERSADLFRRVK
jgi:hypothetical protein